MNASVARRFIVFMVVFMIGAMTLSLIVKGFQDRAPGDLEVELGAQRMEDGLHDEALAFYDEALNQAPGHRGALMGRAIVFTQQDRPEAAIAEFDRLIALLERTLAEDDATGRGALAAAYANRGRIHDLQGRHLQAYEDYKRAVKTDRELVGGPGIVHRILYGDPQPATVEKRLLYLHEQFQKPEGERLLRVPERDSAQRMYKP